VDLFKKIQRGNFVVTPYHCYLGVTSNKAYKVVSVDYTESKVKIFNDLNRLEEYELNIFFEADTFRICNMFRIFSLLFNIRLDMILPK